MWSCETKYISDFAEGYMSNQTNWNKAIILGHAFDLASKDFTGTLVSASVPRNLWRTGYGNRDNGYWGFAGGIDVWQFGAIYVGNNGILIIRIT